MKKYRLGKKLLLLVMGLALFANTSVAYASDLVVEPGAADEIEQEGDQAKSTTYSLGNVQDTYKFYKVTVQSPGMVVLKFFGLDAKGKAALYNSQKTMISQEKDVKMTKPQATYYVRKAGTYYFRLKCSAGDTAKAKYIFTQKGNLGGASFAKAEVMKKGVKKGGILGFETSTAQKQYFKLKVTKEELVKIKLTKGNSCSSTDTMYVEVYKSDDKNNKVTWGWMYEGQAKATLYIRNSSSHKTIPGTYYIVVSKTYPTTGFDYSLTWLK